MPLARQLLPLLIVLVLYAVLVKLAARILRVSQVGWAQAFQFAAVVMIVSIAGRWLTAYVGSMPLVAALVFGFSVQVALGAWFFRERALAANGQELGWGGGAKLTALAVGMLFLLLAALFAVVQATLPSGPG